MALAACSPERPEGAYPAEWPSTCIAGFDTCADLDAGDASKDAGMDAAQPESGDVTDDDGGGLVVDPTNPLSKLAGRYLMRVDYYTTVMAVEGGATLRLKTRVSNLFYTELSDGKGVLNASEKLCDQEAVHECLETCTGWKTQYAMGVTSKIQSMGPIKRAYTVDANNNLSATSEGALLPLGFDDASPVAGQVPTQLDDSVWTLPAGWRGVPTRLTATLTPFAQPVPLDCTVESTQLYATAFHAQLSELSPKELASHTMEVNTVGSNGTVVGVGPNGKPSSYCTPTELNKQSDVVQYAFVRFKETTRRSCPSDPDFNIEFPAASGLDMPTSFDPKP